MDVKNWSVDKIMQLPDWCFGRRWWVGTYIGTAAGAVTYFQIEEQLPERFIVWMMMVSGTDRTAGTGIDLTLRMSAQVPDAESILRHRRIFPGIALGTMMYEFFLDDKPGTLIGGMRNVVEARGERVGGAFKIRNETATCENMIALLISSFPREVPEWLFLA